MIWGYILFVFIGVYGVNLFFNYRRKEFLKKERYLLTLLEAFVVLLALYYTTLLGLMNSLLVVIVLFVVMAITQIYRFTDDRMSEGDNDIKLEAMKNSFLFINITVVPFLIGIVMFRFLPFYIQIPLSILVGITTYFMSKGVQLVLHRMVKKLRFKVNLDGSRKYVYIWVLIGLSGLTVYFFNFPSTQIKNAIELNNHKPIIDLASGYDLDISNYYDTELVSKWETTSLGIEENTEGDPPSYVFYDEENDIMYESYTDISLNTVYKRTFLNGETEEYVIKGKHNLQGYVVNGVVYLVNEDSFVIEIMDGEFRINNIVNIEPKESFVEINNYEDFHIEYRISGNQLKYTTTDLRDEVNYNASYVVVKQDVDLDLPFYTHFTLYHLLLVFGCMLFPITNWKHHITVVDLESKYKSESSVTTS